MPNKFLGKAFRRRSSGNILELTDDGPPAAESSFRVLPRPQDNYQHSFDRIPSPFEPSQLRKLNVTPVRDPYGSNSLGNVSDRGSGNTQASSSTANTRSTDRYSYSSTIPSSPDSRSYEELHAKPAHDLHPLPPPPPPPADPHPALRRSETQPELHSQPSTASKHSFSLKSAGRALSFGPRGSKASANRDTYKTSDAASRDRSVTASSYASTMTPPKLDLGIQDGNWGQSDFGDMFGKGKSTIAEEPNSHAEGDGVDTTFTPADAIVRRGSQYSWSSNASQDRLMSSPRLGQQADSPTLHGDSDAQVVMDAVLASRALEQRHNPNAPDMSLPARPAPRARPPPHPSSYWGQAGPSSFRASPKTPVGAFGSRDVDRYDYDATPRANGNNAADDEPLFDAPRQRRPMRFNARASTLTKKTTSRVMTKEEFERFKQQKADGSNDDGSKSESESESDNYEDEDETERDREAIKQRRRQEASMAVYRQQMRKYTGEQPAELPPVQRPGVTLQRSSASAPQLSINFDGGTEQPGPKASDDEDDDVPLGVLQAHGFPTKSRPPTRASMDPVVLRPLSQMSAYPQPAGATRNDPNLGGGGNLNLPAFAKNLPQDPYIGASLVRPSDRESLRMNNLTNPGQQPTPSGLPPGGLVGVIAGEERAKALRRGSPNQRGTYDATPSSQLPGEQQQQQQQMRQMQQMQQQMMMMGQMPGMDGMPMTPGEQATANISQQMAQMMQMQMQMMQQMMQMQQNPNMPQMQMPQMPNMMGNGFQAPERPMSAPGHQRGASAASHRTASGMLGPRPGSSAMSVSGLNPGYAASLAPSERSTAGQPSRYRPVTPSVAGQVASGNDSGNNSRTSTMSASTAVPGFGKTQTRSMLGQQSMEAPSEGKNTIRAINKPKIGSRVDDEDDEDGWAEVAAKKKQKKMTWLKRKTAMPAMPGQQEEGGGLEGLYYEG